ncbi:MAG: hypothetical protein HZB16_24190 [Armatimonadetes bacterium]|nr:hypothetical protein [Armatimonadota bacterium]
MVVAGLMTSAQAQGTTDPSGGDDPPVVTRQQQPPPPPPTDIASNAVGVYILAGPSVLRLDPKNLALLLTKELPKPTQTVTGSTGQQLDAPPRPSCIAANSQAVYVLAGAKVLKLDCTTLALLASRDLPKPTTTTAASSTGGATGQAGPPPGPISANEVGVYVMAGPTVIRLDPATLAAVSTTTLPKPPPPPTGGTTTTTTTTTSTTGGNRK